MQSQSVLVIVINTLTVKLKNAEPAKSSVTANVLQYILTENFFPFQTFSSEILYRFWLLTFQDVFPFELFRIST